MYSINYLKEKFEKIAKISLINPARDDAFCSIGVTTTGFTLACLRKDKTKTELDFIENVVCSPSTFMMELWGIVKKHNLDGVNCSWVLNPSQYQMLIYDELPVKEEEFQSAIRWQIRKLLPYPIDDALIDSFPIPPAQISNPKKMIMIVTAQASYIQPIASQISESGLNLSSIDIQELALRNINSLYEKDDGSTALLYLQEEASQLIITRQKLFYFSRHLDWNFNSLTQASVNQENVATYLDKLALEVQRSFDYFQSQWRYPAPTKVLVASLSADVLDIASYLAQRLRLQALNLNLHEVLPAKHKLSRSLEFQHLSIIGGVLRDELEYVSTN